MAALSKDARSGTYRYRPVYQRRQIFCRLDTKSKREAEALAYSIDRAIHDLETGQRSVPPGIDVLDWIRSGGTLVPGQNRQHNLEELIESYQESVPIGAKAESTLRTERIHLKHFLEFFGARASLTSIHAQAVEGYVGWRRGVDSLTLKKELSTLGLVWRYAERIGWAVGQVPTKGIRLPKKAQKERFRTFSEITAMLPNTSSAKQSDLWECCVLDSDEIAKFLEHVRTIRTPSFLAPMIHTAAYTGARRSELMRSRKHDWDLSSKVLTIREKKRIHSASESFRYVDLNPSLIKNVESLLNSIKSHLVFSNKPDRELLPVQAAKLWERAVKGTSWENLRGWHVLRHSFASNLAAAGVAESVIDKYMGHMTKSMRDRYRHLLPNDRQSAIAALSSYGG